VASSFAEESAPTIRINCPVCGGKSLPATVFGWDHLLLLAVPVYRELYVRCSVCQGQSRLLHANVQQLASLSAQEIDPYLIPPAPRRGKTVAGFALVLFWVPIVGLYIACLACRQNRGTHGVANGASVAALIGAGLVNLAVAMALAMIPILLLTRK
jgi:hypothetical protein